MLTREELSMLTALETDEDEHPTPRQKATMTELFLVFLVVFSIPIALMTIGLATVIRWVFG